MGNMAKIVDFFIDEQSNKCKGPKLLITNHKDQISQLMLDSLRTSLETADEFKTGLKNTLDQIDNGYKSIMRMHKITFYLGIALIVVAAILAILNVISGIGETRLDKSQPLLSVLFGGLGTTDIIYYFIKKPVRNLQNSRANLAQLEAVIFNWFIDEFYWRNMYNRELYGNEDLNFQEWEKVSAKLLDNTERTMQLIEKYCELYENKTK